MRMQWIEQTDGPIKPDDFFDFPYSYWMDIVDPRGKYLQEFEDYRMSGGGVY